MGFLDKLLGKGRRAESASSKAEASAPAKSLLHALGPKQTGGPLNLAVGDFVSHYRVRYAVTGVRVLEGDGAKLWHYCLRDDKGASAVLEAPEGADPAYSLQRSVKTSTSWDADVATDLGDAPLRLAARGRRKVRSWGDAGIAATVHTMEHRELRDTAGDRRLLLEDFQGAREARLAESVLDVEFEFERAGAGASGGMYTAAMAGSSDFEEQKTQDIVKGTPRAAAKALDNNVGNLGAEPEVVQPMGYGDDSWLEHTDEQPSQPMRRLVVHTRKVDEEEEWISAAEVAREKKE